MPQKLRLEIPDPEQSSTRSISPDERFAPEIIATLTSRRKESTVLEQLSETQWQSAARAGDVVVLRQLGEGTGGAVRLCRLKGHRTLFALKQVLASPDPELQTQVLRELQFNRSCDSPFIVKYFGAYLDEQEGSIFIAMEYCEAGSLDAIARKVKHRGGRIGERVLASIADSVLNGIEYLYRRQIIHRDIKPQNILLTKKGEVKLCDFGVSGLVVNSLATTFMGTSFYMAPERIQGQPYSVRSDVWSLGLTLYELANESVSFGGSDKHSLLPIEVLADIVKMELPELQDEPENGIRWSAALRHFLSKALEKDPNVRPSPRDMLEHPWLVGHRKKPVAMDVFVAQL